MLIRLPPLSQNKATEALRSVQAELGESDRQRLADLVPLIGDDGRIRLSAVLERLFPRFSVEDALTRFRQLRARLRQAAETLDVELELVVDSRKRSPPDQRWCWFVGETLVVAKVERYSREEAQGAQPTEPIRQAALVQLETRDGKPVLRYFISYAHKDRKLKDDLLGRLRTRFDCSTEFVFEGWEDGEILPGENWRDAIERAIERCHFGLLLVSHEFLASRFITREELQRFVPLEPAEPVAWRHAVPVGLKRVPFDGTVDLKGLAELQIFRHDEKFYALFRGEHTRDAFADELFRRILLLARENVAGPGSAPPMTTSAAVADTTAPPSATLARTPPPSLSLDRALVLAREQREYLEEGADPALIVPAEGLPTRLSKELEHASGAPGVSGERVDALDFLEKWLRRPGAPPFCALLGDYGMGKTTTCKALTLRLLAVRESDASVPLPIYLDLRHLGEAASRSNPSLSEILHTVIRRSWRSGREVSDLDAAEIVRLVQEEGALVLFDGLDEVLVHLTPAGGQLFTRELWRILPPSVFQRRAAEASAGGARPGRLLISCRTHYFRTLREQASHLTGEDREGITAGDYQALLLLPFTETQICDYLRRNLPDQRLERLLELIHSVHNLPELAERPYTLSLIAAHITQIERWRMEGRKVTGVTLYRHMVESWLDRDTGKHQLTRDHKLRLMEHLAAALWRSGRRAWRIDDLEQWLIDFLEANPRVAAHYHGRDRELLKEDLRTATFLVREGEADFRFAHTSLQEFFLAAWLRRALVGGRFEDWEMAIPSTETLLFLGQLLEEAETGPALAGLGALRDRYRPRASELAFAYCLYAWRQGLPVSPLTGFRLETADLHDWHIGRRGPGNLLDLRDAVFEEARLQGAVFEGVDLSGAHLSGARLERTELLSGRAHGADFRRSALAGCRFRLFDLRKCSFAGADFHRTQFLRCRLDEVDGIAAGSSEVLLAACEPAERLSTCKIGNTVSTARWLEGSEDSAQRPPLVNGATRPTADVFQGHSHRINACAFSPSGTRILSAASDGILWIWDSRSGEPLISLRGHHGGVNTCCFSPDGSRIISGSSDKILQLWNANNGERLMSLGDHQAPVEACAFSPDSRKVLSASADHTLRLWNAHSGELLHILQGHQDTVNACAFSPDGDMLLSASYDRTLRLWNAHSGDLILILQGHQEAVSACAFSPDGYRVLSASHDGTLRLWNAHSGDLILILQGHEHWVSACAFSPDGEKLLSASYDETLRLWDAHSGESLIQFRGHFGCITGCAFSPDGRTVLSSSDDQTLRLWDGRSGELLITFGRYRPWINTCAFSSDGNRLASASYNVLRLWNPGSGELLLSVKGHQDRINACSLSPDGSKLISASDDRTLRLWDSHSGNSLLVLEGHKGPVNDCAFSPDGSKLISASDDRTLRLWDSHSGNSLLVLEGHLGKVKACDFSPDGERILSAGSDNTLRLWDVLSGEAALSPIEQRAAYTCAFSPDGDKFLATSFVDPIPRLWSARSGELLLSLRGNEAGISACTFSPDGERILVGTFDHKLRLWDARSGELLFTFEGHENWVNACAFSPTGSRLVSAGADGTLRIWDPDSGRETDHRTYESLDGDVAVLAADRSVILWATPGAWRWLGWIAPDRDTGALTRYPAEIYGPIPTPRGAPER